MRGSQEEEEEEEELVVAENCWIDCCICCYPCASWMMEIQNRDMMSAAKRLDVESLLVNVGRGVQIDYTESDTGNQVLHWVVFVCQDACKRQGDAETLGITILDDGSSNMKSVLQPATRKQKALLKHELHQWESRRDAEIACIQLLCRAGADPEATNKIGATPVDMCEHKDPGVVRALHEHVEKLKKEATDAEAAEKARIEGMCCGGCCGGWCCGCC